MILGENTSFDNSLQYFFKWKNMYLSIAIYIAKNQNYFKNENTWYIYKCV
jgi:hypothetical protein